MAFTFTTLKTAIQDYTDNAETTFVSQLFRLASVPYVHSSKMGTA